MAPDIECMKLAPLKLGDGPYWHSDSQSLYLVDTSGSIIKHSPKIEKTIFHALGERTSFIIPVKGNENHFIIGKGLDIMHIHWDPDSNTLIHQQVLITPDDRPNSKISNAKCDVLGRLWFGTYCDQFENGTGALYSFTQKEGLITHLPKVRLSNGIGFSPDYKTLYHVDSLTFEVNKYDLDVNKGTIKFKKTVIDFKKAKLTGMPHGLTVDLEGKLWIACLLGSHVIRVNPDNGKILQTIKFDKSSLITSVAFGGVNLDELYVTSGNIPEKTFNSPEAGCTFKVSNLGTTGILPYAFNLDLTT